MLMFVLFKSLLKICFNVFFPLFHSTLLNMVLSMEYQH